jgi:hypothetical protein
MIALARDHGVHEWLVTSLNQYARLGRSITLQDVQRLGLNYILKITQIRENFTRTGSNGVSEVQHRRTFAFFGPSLAELFRHEIKRSNVQMPPVTPNPVGNFDLVDIFFLVSLNSGTL